MQRKALLSRSPTPRWQTNYVRQRKASRTSVTPLTIRHHADMFEMHVASSFADPRPDERAREWSVTRLESLTNMKRKRCQAMALPNRPLSHVVDWPARRVSSIRRETVFLRRSPVRDQFIHEIGKGWQEWWSAQPVHVRKWMTLGVVDFTSEPLFAGRSSFIALNGPTCSVGNPSCNG